jgi:hypothetical protein
MLSWKKAKICLNCENIGTFEEDEDFVEIEDELDNEEN